MSNQPLAKIERILIATDGSQQAEWAAQYGQQLAQQLDARVLLVHVMVPATSQSGDFATARRLEEVRREYGEELLARTRRSFPSEVDVTTSQRIGLPYEEIAAEAKSWKADLVLLGTHGHGRIASLVLGSTADAVIRQAPCPVITISQEPKYEPEHKTGWTSAGTYISEPAPAHVQHASADEL